MPTGVVKWFDVKKGFGFITGPGDGKDVFVAGVMEHIEEAGVHSGDSACALPPYSLPKTIIAEIEKAIQKSDLGLTPISDGKIVRINIPVLTEERRKELVKVVKRMEEESKVALRNLRRDANEQLKTAKKDKEISEDEQFKLQDEVQKLMDKSIEKAAEVADSKSKEILEV